MILEKHVRLSALRHYFLALFGFLCIAGGVSLLWGAERIRSHTSYDLGVVSPYTKEVLAASHKYQIEPELIAAVIVHESCVIGGDTDCRAVNPRLPGGAGEKGLMQIHPSHFGRIPPARFEDPAFNIDFGTRLLRIALNERQGNYFCGLSAYNTGPGIWCANARNYSGLTLQTYAMLKARRKTYLSPF
jgi:soluble lytic murein transglycosylase-like protein